MSTILIVDDSKFMRMYLKKILTEYGHEVVGEANNGFEAIRAYTNIKPELTLMDVTMPEMDGIQSTGKIKEIDPNARIIIVSAMGQEWHIINAIRAGAMDFITKPFYKDRVKEAINRALISSQGQVNR